jgi:hypothetical protein
MATTEEAARKRKVHGNDPTHRTTKIQCTAKALGIAVPHPLPCKSLHGNVLFSKQEFLVML